MYKICLTGGPSGGKSTMLPLLKAHFESRPLGSGGYNVFTLPEVPTLFFSNGAPRATNPLELSSLQGAMIDTQLAMENGFGEIASSRKSPYGLLICDRGLLDGYAFCSPALFFDLIVQRRQSVADLLARYDAIIHLASTANGAMDYYKTGVGTPRVETPEQSIQIDKKLGELYKHHSAYHFLDNSTNFEGKVSRTIAIIESILNHD